jgi:hypothetical protein
MKFLISLAAAGALLVCSAAAQQYPAQEQQSPQQQYPNQYPEQYPAQNQYPGQNQQYPQQQNSGYYGNNGYYGPSIPAGTQLKIRTNENIVADAQSAGRTYAAEIADDVMVRNGQVLIPRGSPAQLTVQQIGSGTMGVGNNEVALALQSVSVNGRTYNVISNTTNASNNRGIGANKRTAEMTGGGALLGTIIGAVAGGGKGALIGAVVGGAGGAAAQVLTRGKEVKVPAESVLTFKLDQPLMLQ